MSKIFKYSSAAYLILIMLIKMMGMQIAVLDYALNRDFIAANLCENRLAPQTHCEGRCFLKKQLTRTGETPGSASHKSASKVVVVDFFENGRETTAVLRADQPTRLIRLTLGTIPSISIPAVFHPPLA